MPETYPTDIAYGSPKKPRSIEEQIHDDLRSYRVQLRIVTWAITIVVCLAALFGLAIMVALVWGGEKVILDASAGPFELFLKKTATQGEALFKMTVAGIATMVVRQLLVPIKKQLKEDVKEKFEELAKLARQNSPPRRQESANKEPSP
jgi:membrane protein implicated in regulation of membrane protease activity